MSILSNIAQFILSGSFITVPLSYVINGTKKAYYDTREGLLFKSLNYENYSRFEITSKDIIVDLLRLPDGRLIVLTETEILILAKDNTSIESIYQTNTPFGELHNKLLLLKNNLIVDYSRSLITFYKINNTDYSLEKVSEIKERGNDENFGEISLLEMNNGNLIYLLCTNSEKLLIIYKRDSKYNYIKDNEADISVLSKNKFVMNIIEFSSNKNICICADDNLFLINSETLNNDQGIKLPFDVKILFKLNEKCLLVVSSDNDKALVINIENENALMEIALNPTRNIDFFFKAKDNRIFSIEDSTNPSGDYSILEWEFVKDEIKLKGLVCNGIKGSIKGFSDLNSGDIAFSANRNELNFYKNNSN